MVLFVSLLTSYVLGYVSYLSNSFFGTSFLRDTETTAFWLWLGLTAANTVRLDVFEKRRKKLTLINIGNQLATLLVMGLIIGILKP